MSDDETYTLAKVITEKYDDEYFTKAPYWLDVVGDNNGWIKLEKGNHPLWRVEIRDEEVGEAYVIHDSMPERALLIALKICAEAIIKRKTV